MQRSTFNTLATLAAIIFSTTLSLPSLAASEHDAHHSSATAPADADKVDGVVKKVDKVAGKVTLSHGPLSNLDMPAMTMAFRVKDAKWLDMLMPGTKIRFVAEQIDGVLTVVSFETVK